MEVAHDILDQYIRAAPSDQNAVDIFADEWSSSVPGVERTGSAALFSDGRITWAVAEFGGVEGRTVLELGPLEAGHTTMLEAAGAAEIVAIEANTRAYLKCLVVKEIMGLRRARFLCGDFVEYLRTGTRHFDVGIASGVLYHMQNPIELLSLLTRSCDQLFLWTHYFDADIVAGLPHVAEKFVGAERVTVEGFPHTLHHYAYGDALGWAGFCGGGTNPAWLERSEILAALSHLGMEDIRVNLENVHHQNGPSFALVARRASQFMGNRPSGRKNAATPESKPVDTFEPNKGQCEAQSKPLVDGSFTGSMNDRSTAMLSERITQRERAIAQLGAELADRDREIERLSVRVTDMERIILERDALALDRQILTQRLDSIESRLTFAILEKAWFAQRRVAPPGTLRGRVWLAAPRLARALLHLPRPPILQVQEEPLSEEPPSVDLVQDEPAEAQDPVQSVNPLPAVSPALSPEQSHGDSEELSPLSSGDPLPYEPTLSAAARAGRVLHRDDIYGSGPPTTAPSPECLSLIAAHTGSPVLDVGCGLGVYLAALQERGMHAIGLEINADLVAAARSLNRDVRLYDGTSIPFPDGTFDTVMALEVLEHVPHWETTLQEMLRVARRCVLISVPNIGVIPAMSRHLVVPWHLLEATHVNFFTREILDRYLSRIPNITSDVTHYGAFGINGETYHNHLFAVIQKIPRDELAGSQPIASDTGENAH